MNQWKEQIENMFQLLESQDVVSDTVIELLAFTIQRDGVSYLPRLFAAFHSKNNSLKSNAIKVVSLLLKSSKTLLSESSINSIHYQQQIVSLILSNVESLSIPLRDLVKELFFSISPNVLFPKLIQKISKENVDARTRSIIVFFYKETIMNHYNPIQSLDALLASIRHINTIDNADVKMIQYPSDIYIKEIANQSMDKKRMEQILQPVSDWIQNLSQENQKTILLSIIQQLFDHPSCTVIVSFASHCTILFREHYSIVFEQVDSQMKLNNKEDISLFTKLSPLLLLRMVPIDGYSNPDSKRVLEILFTIFKNEKEYKELRRVAAEVLAKYPPSYGLLKEIASLLVSEINELNNLDTLKLGIYFICNSLSIFTPSKDSKDIWNVLLKVFFQLYDLLALPDNQGKSYLV